MIILCLFYADSNDDYADYADYADADDCADYESEGFKCVPENDCEVTFSTILSIDSNPTCNDPSQTCCYQERVKKGR